MIPLLALVPPAGEGISLQPPVPLVHSLSDGTPVWALDRGDGPVRIEVSLGSGTAGLVDREAGTLAGVLAGALSGSLEERRADLGAVVSIGVGSQRVWADVEVAAGREADGAALLRAALETPDFSRRAVAEIRQRAGMAPLARALSAALFPPGHPLDFRPTAADWRDVTPRRVQAAWEQLLEDGAPSIVVVGGLSAQTLPAIEASLRGLGGTGHPLDIPPPDWRGVVVEGVDLPADAQVHLTLALPAPGSRDVLLPAAELAVAVLGGSFTSRLSATLRESQGLVYGIDASVQAWPGMGEVLVRCEAPAAHALAVLEGIDAAAASMVSAPPTAAEIHTARQAILLEQARAMGRLSALARAPGLDLLYGGDPTAWQARISAYNSVDEASVARVSAELFGGEHAVWVIGGDREVLAPVLETAGWLRSSDW